MDTVFQIRTSKILEQANEMIENLTNVKQIKNISRKDEIYQLPEWMKSSTQF
jgi:cell division protein FtsX